MCLTVPKRWAILDRLACERGRYVTIRHWRLALIAWMVLIYVVSSSLFSFDSTKQVLVYDPLNVAVRKFAHMVEYAVLAYLWFRSLWTVRDRFNTYLGWSIVLAVVYAASDEWHQSFVPERLGIWTDVVWDAMGAVAMGFALRALRYRGEVNVQRMVLGPLAVEKTLR